MATTPIGWKSCNVLTDPLPIPKTTDDAPLSQSASLIFNRDINTTLTARSMKSDAASRPELLNSRDATPGSPAMGMLSAMSTSSSSSSSSIAQCAYIEVPLSWSDAPSVNQPKINVFVKKLSARKSPVIGQLWLLNGGPGLGGNSLDQMATVLRNALVNYDIMIPDQRGTARSSFLECDTGDFDSSDMDLVSACWSNLQGTYGSSLHDWGTTSAAKDVLYLQSVTKPNDNSIFAAYGVSYGSFLLNRILTIAPNVVHTSIFDSVIPPDMDFNQRDLHFQEAGEMLLDLCSDSEDCNGRFEQTFGQNVSSIVSLVLHNQNSMDSACLATLYPAHTIRRLMARLLLYKHYRRLIFPTIYRLNRCSTKDKNWLKNMHMKLVKRLHLDKSYNLMSGANGPAPFSSAIYHLLTVSELTKHPVSDYGAHTVDNSTLFDAHLSGFLKQKSSVLASGRYIDDSEPYPTQHVLPVLTIQSSLDPVSPISFLDSWTRAYNRTNNHVVVVPNAIHGVVPDSAKGEGKELCALNMMAVFIKDDSVAPPVACINETEDAQFQFSKLFDKSDLLIGRSELWDGGPDRTFAEARFLVIVIVSTVALFPVLLTTMATIILFLIIAIRGSMEASTFDSSIVPILDDSMNEVLPEGHPAERNNDNGAQLDEVEI